MEKLLPEKLLLEKAAIEDARENDEEVLSISQEDFKVIIGEHIADVVKVSGSIGINRQNAIIGPTSYDSQHQNDDIPA